MKECRFIPDAPPVDRRVRFRCLDCDAHFTVELDKQGSFYAAMMAAETACAANQAVTILHKQASGKA